MLELKANKNNNTTGRMSHLIKMTQRQRSMGNFAYYAK